MFHSIVESKKNTCSISCSITHSITCFLRVCQSCGSGMFPVGTQTRPIFFWGLGESDLAGLTFVWVAQDDQLDCWRFWADDNLAGQTCYVWMYVCRDVCMQGCMYTTGPTQFLVVLRWIFNPAGRTHVRPGLRQGKKNIGVFFWERQILLPGHLKSYPPSVLQCIPMQRPPKYPLTKNRHFKLFLSSLIS